MSAWDDEDDIFYGDQFNTMVEARKKGQPYRAPPTAPARPADPTPAPRNNDRPASASAAAAADSSIQDNNGGDDDDEIADELGIGQEVEARARRGAGTRARLDEDRLLDPVLGVAHIQRYRRLEVRLRGRGHERGDLARVLRFYQLWAHRLFPVKFDDFIRAVRRVGERPKMKRFRKEWMDEEYSATKRARNEDTPVVESGDAGRNAAAAAAAAAAAVAPAAAPADSIFVSGAGAGAFEDDDYDDDIFDDAFAPSKPAPTSSPATQTTTETATHGSPAAAAAPQKEASPFELEDSDDGEVLAPGARRSAVQNTDTGGSRAAEVSQQTSRPPFEVNSDDDEDDDEGLVGTSSQRSLGRPIRSRALRVSDDEDDEDDEDDDDMAGLGSQRSLGRPIRAKKPFDFESEDEEDVEVVGKAAGSGGSSGADQPPDEDLEDYMLDALEAAADLGF